MFQRLLLFQTKQDETYEKIVEDAAELPDLEEEDGEGFSDSFVIPSNDDVTDNPQQEFVCSLYCIIFTLPVFSATINIRKILTFNFP